MSAFAAAVLFLSLGELASSLAIGKRWRVDATGGRPFQVSGTDSLLLLGLKR